MQTSVVVVWFLKWVAGKPVTRRKGMSLVYISQSCFFGRVFWGAQQGSGSEGLRSRPWRVAPLLCEFFNEAAKGLLISSADSCVFQHDRKEEAHS